MPMAARRPTDHLIDRLPPVRGEYRPGVALARFTWFRAGGPAEMLYIPADEEDLGRFLAHTPEDIPLTVIGVASNLLIRDGGIPGVTIRLRNAFARLDRTDAGVRAGAGALDINVARFAADEGLSGLEFLSGIPGTIGGALRMNAGAYGNEMKDVLVRATAFDRQGNRHAPDGAAMGFGYRRSGAPEDWIFLSAEMSALPAAPEKIAGRMAEIGAARNDTQPVRSRTGGSTFKNPPGKHAWQLIDAAGCRGLTVGKAMVSAKHCNFLINTGGATAHELECLGEEVRRRVLAHSGDDLQWEIKRVGVDANGGRA
ncbi:MAG: UDP-N-acetylmuramate dehydrogenase [Alphaproteobacteria bacterium]|nr:UDP-N-acetylmuramate dehydrogenase [Alphaproteobacteria bacterium]